MTRRRAVALITGGRRGIGRGCAYALAEAGFDVVINDLERDAAAEETLAGIAERGAKAAFVAGDIADLERHEGLLDAAMAAGGAVDCLVNNAGVTVLSRGDLLDITVESYDRCLDINLRGTFFLTQRLARRLLVAPRPDGDPARSIITITSANAEVVSPARGEYCISKAGLSMMSKLFAVRLADAGIAVYEVRPGVIRTDMTAPVKETYDRQIADGLTPIPRWGEIGEIGTAVATLASGGLPFTVGQVVAVDGGLTLRTL